MIKLELAHCCMNCDFADIQKTVCSQPEFIEEGLALNVRFKLDNVQIVGCSHRKVCEDYLKEPLKALPADQLFGSED